MVLSTPPVSPASSITSVVVQSGDWLSKIAKTYHVTLPDLESWNPETKADPDLIWPGERIAVVLHGPHSPVGWTPSGYVGKHRPAAPSASTGGSEPEDGLSGSSTPSGPPSHTSSGSGGSSSGSGNSGSHSAADLTFQACVIRAESGGDAQIWNGSGHWGLYQFSASTWAYYGGDPARFGNADAAYQTEIFWNVMATGNWYGTWGEWDGCQLA